MEPRHCGESEARDRDGEESAQGLPRGRERKEAWWEEKTLFVPTPRETAAAGEEDAMGEADVEEGCCHAVSRELLLGAAA